MAEPCGQVSKFNLWGSPGFQLPRVGCNFLELPGLPGRKLLGIPSAGFWGLRVKGSGVRVGGRGVLRWKQDFCVWC